MLHNTRSSILRVLLNVTAKETIKMYKVELDKSLCRIIKLFYKIGIWNEDELTFRNKTRKLLYFLNYILFVLFILTLVFLTKDKSQVIFLIECVIGVGVITVKLLYLIRKKDEILTFLYDKIVTHSIANFDESVEVKKIIEKVIKFIRSYILILPVASNFIITACLPIFSSEKRLPMFIRYDFGIYSDYDTVIYWMLYVYVGTGLVISVVFNFLMIFIWYIMFNYAIEYKLLGNQLRRLGHTMEKKDAKKAQPTRRNSFQKDLIALICAERNLSEYDLTSIS